MTTSTRIATGIVTSGRGHARAHIVENAGEISSLTGRRFFPGSLNVVLKRPLLLSNETALRFGNSQRLLWPGRLNRLPVWFYRWQHSPLHVLEVLSEARLRDQLELHDGDAVEIEIEAVHSDYLSPTRRLAWLALWGGRAHWAYARDGYYWRTRPLAVELGLTQDNEEHGMMTKIAKRIYHKTRDWAVVGPALVRLRNAVRVPHDAEAPRYVFAREDVDRGQSATDKELARIRNLLNYTKTSGSAYAAQQYPAGYHTLDLFGQELRGQRDPRMRFRNLPLDFRGKRVLDIGTNQGGMLLAIRDQLELGVGLDYDPHMINAANRLAAGAGANNLHYFVFDLEKDPLELISDLVPGGRVDVIFLLSVCMWLQNWKSVIRFCANKAPVLVFESNGSDAQQAAQEAELRTHFGNVRMIEDCSDDDPAQKRRRLFMCEEPRQQYAAGGWTAPTMSVAS